MATGLAASGSGAVARSARHERRRGRTWDRGPGVQLAAGAQALQAPSAQRPRVAAPAGPRHRGPTHPAPRRRPDGRPVRAPRPAVGGSSRVSASSTAPGSPVIVASRLAGGRWASWRSSHLARGEAGRVPAHQGLHARGGRGRRRRRPPPPGRASAGGVAPPAQRLLLGAQVDRGPAAARCRAGRTAAYPPAATGSRARAWPRRPAAPRPPSASTRSPPSGAHPGPREGPAELLGGPRRPRAPGRAGRGGRTPGSAQRRAGAAHQRQAGGVVGPVSASGPWQAAHRAGVRQRSQASAAAYPARGVCTRTGPVAEAARSASWTSVRHPRARGRRVALEVAVDAPATLDRDPLAQPPRAGASSWAQPVRRRYSASTVRANPPTSAPAPSRSARSSSVSRVWG